MKAVAMFVILGGYVAVAFGVNHLTGGCVSFKDVIWPSTSTITDPCANSGGATKGAGAPTGQSVGGGGTTTAGAPSPTNIGSRGSSGGGTGQSPSRQVGPAGPTHPGR